MIYKNTNFNFLAICFLVVFFCIPASGYQIDAGSTFPLKAGAGKKNVTPDKRIKNWVTGKEYAGIRDSIYVSALVLNDGLKDVVIVAWDLVDAGESATDEVRERISEALKIPKDNILVNASHGVHYVGLPGEKALGGYEMERGTVGTDESGQILIDLAINLLDEARKEQETK